MSAKEKSTTATERRALREEAIRRYLSGAHPHSRGARAFLRGKIHQLREEKKEAARSSSVSSTNREVNTVVHKEDQTATKKFGGMPADDNPQVWARAEKTAEQRRRSELECMPTQTVMEMIYKLQIDKSRAFKLSAPQPLIDQVFRLYLNMEQATLREKKEAIDIIIEAEAIRKQNDRIEEEKAKFPLMEGRTLRQLTDVKLIDYLKGLVNDRQFKAKTNQREYDNLMALSITSTPPLFDFERTDMIKALLRAQTGK